MTFAACGFMRKNLFPRRRWKRYPWNVMIKLRQKRAETQIAACIATMRRRHPTQVKVRSTRIADITVRKIPWT
jgi:hypothetical protein